MQAGGWCYISAETRGLPIGRRQREGVQSEVGQQRCSDVAQTPRELKEKATDSVIPPQTRRRRFSSRRFSSRSRRTMESEAVSYRQVGKKAVGRVKRGLPPPHTPLLARAPR